MSSYIIPKTMRTNFQSLQLFLFSLSLLLGLSKPDPDPIQDYCIADTQKPQAVYLNGAPCIDPELATPSHFSTSSLSKPGNTSANKFGFNSTPTNIINLPGLNTLGLVLVRVDIAADGIVPPHSHPRASEVTTCLQGTLLVGFIDTSNRVFTQNLKAGESFVFPKGLIHFLYNFDTRKPALAISGLNSQNPGTQIASVATFASTPGVPNEVLAKAFQISQQEVKIIRKNLGG